MTLKCVVVKRTGNSITWNNQIDYWYHDLLNSSSDVCSPEEMSAKDPMFILYTSGSTGKPKGVLHTTGGYLVYASITHQYILIVIMMISTGVQQTLVGLRGTPILLWPIVQWINNINV